MIKINNNYKYTEKHKIMSGDAALLVIDEGRRRGSELCRGISAEYLIIQETG